MLLAYQEKKIPVSDFEKKNVVCLNACIDSLILSVVLGSPSVLLSLWFYVGLFIPLLLMCSCNMYTKGL